MTRTDQPIIVGLGEVLWDIFPDGARFGGAPANFACHIAHLGGHSELVSAVGLDDYGRRALESLERMGVKTSQITPSDRWPTGTVKVTVNEQGQPSYLISQPAAWDHIAWSDSLAELASRTTAVCFGTLGQRSPTSRQTIRDYIGTMKKDSIRVLDVNLRQDFFDAATIVQSLELANVLKLNDEELGIVAAASGMNAKESSDKELLNEIATRFELKLVALTRGGEGATVWSDKQFTETDAVRVEVKDTVGAGDAFTAALVMGMLSQADLTETVQHANRVAAFVCTQHGATPSLPESYVKHRTDR